MSALMLCKDKYKYEYRHGGNVHAEPNGGNFLDFSACVNPLGPPEPVFEAIREAACFIERYPDSRSTELRKSIATFEHIPSDWIVCGNGSSDLMFRLPRAVKAETGLVLKPSFSDYERALLATNADVSFHQLHDENEFLCDEHLLETLKSKPVDLLFLCNPNNPTGMLTERQLIEQILLICERAGTTLVIDECFMDLVADSDRYTAKPLLSKHKNLVIIKAVTKTFALPGLRLGYAICSDPRLIDKLYFYGPDWPVSNIAQAVGITVLRDADRYLKESLAFIDMQRRYIANELKELGYRVFDGRANFLFANNPYDFDMKTELDKEFIRIRSFGVKDDIGTNYFRIGFLTQENNIRLIETVQKITPKEPEV